MIDRFITPASLVFAIVAVSLLGSDAHAAFGISGTLGAIEVAPPPVLGVNPGATEGGVPIIFAEILSGTVKNAAGLRVDHNGTDVVASPTISGNVVNPNLVPSTLSFGTLFNSYLFHFDPVGTPSLFSNPKPEYVSVITFDQPVIGVQLFSDGFILQKPFGTPYTGSLEAGDAEVAANGGSSLAYYPGSVAFRGVEEDAFVLAIFGNSIMLAGSAQGLEIDQIRIFTAGVPGVDPTAVPELGAAFTWALMSLTCCVGGIFACRRCSFFA